MAALRFLPMIDKITDLLFRFAVMAICGFAIGTILVGIIFNVANLLAIALIH